jgi:protein-tyrosine-phosphatase
MAEAMLRQAFDEALGDFAKDVNVISAGVSACPGDPASRHAETAMEELGLDVSHHQASPVSGKTLSDADLVLTMTIAQKDKLLKDYALIEGKIMTLIEFADLAEELGEDIEDPFGGSLETYRGSAHQISRAVKVITRKIKDLFESSRLRTDSHEDLHEN